MALTNFHLWFNHQTSTINLHVVPNWNRYFQNIISAQNVQTCSISNTIDPLDTIKCIRGQFYTFWRGAVKLSAGTEKTWKTLENPFHCSETYQGSVTQGEESWRDEKCNCSDPKVTRIVTCYLKLFFWLTEDDYVNSAHVRVHSWFSPLPSHSPCLPTSPNQDH